VSMIGQKLSLSLSLSLSEKQQSTFLSVSWFPFICSQFLFYGLLFLKERTAKMRSFCSCSAEAIKLLHLLPVLLGLLSESPALVTVRAAETEFYEIVAYSNNLPSRRAARLQADAPEYMRIVSNINPLFTSVVAGTDKIFDTTLDSIGGLVYGQGGRQRHLSSIDEERDRRAPVYHRDLAIKECPKSCKCIG